jgi:hypothetical protein
MVVANVSCDPIVWDLIAVYSGWSPRSLTYDECSAGQFKPRKGLQPSLGRGKGNLKRMKRIHIVGIAFAAIFAFSMFSASGASAFTLWDQCSKVAAGTGKFTTADCNVLGTGEWEWLELTAAEKTDSLLAILLLESDFVDLECEGFMIGTVGAGSKDEVTEILNDALELLELGVLADICKVKSDLFGLCGGAVTAEAWPENLPWLTELTANGDLLGAHAVGVNPGWFIKCGSSLNECTRADTFLTVENLLAELEVDLGFKPLEEATCSIGKGIVEGTVSILLENGNGLQAM